MRRSLLALLALALVVAAPAGASGDGVSGSTEPVEDETEVLEPCADTDATVVTPGGNAASIDAPMGPAYVGEERADFVLDLAGRPVDLVRARINVVMSWDIPAEDYDLRLLDANGVQLDQSDAIQPLDGPEEYVSGVFRHCERFTLVAQNWAATGLLELDLDIDVVPLNL